MSVALRVEVPIASFRQSRAREYAETYAAPPPATVYGMLLSLVGETDRYRYLGSRLAIGLLSCPQRSTVVRTFRRYKKKDIADASNARPDYQALLAGLQLAVWISPGQCEADPALPEHVRTALDRPDEIERFGGLCLGESHDLVDTVEYLPAEDTSVCPQWLEQDADGLLTLPVWVDHVGSQRTRWRRFSLADPAAQYEPPETAWVAIQRD